MELCLIVMIGIALAIDVLILAVDELKSSYCRVKLIVLMGMFQSLSIYTGAVLGILFNQYIVKFLDTLGLIILAIIGGVSIIQSHNNARVRRIYVKRESKIYVSLILSIIIDSVIIGFITLNGISEFMLVALYAIIIGLITMLVYYIGLLISDNINEVNLVIYYGQLIVGIIFIVFTIIMIVFYT